MRTKKYKDKKLKKKKVSRKKRNTKKIKKIKKSIGSFHIQGGEPIPPKDVYGYLNVSEIIYQFIDNNLDYFDLDRNTQDHSIDMNCLKKYIRHQKEKPQSEPFWTFYEYLYDNIQYISNSRIDKQYRKNAKELFNLYKNGSINGFECNLVLIFTYDCMKSNYYFTLYFLYLYRKLYPNDYQHLQVILEDEIDIETEEYFAMREKYSLENRIEFDYENKHTIYIMTDDFSYSGTQMNTEIQDYFDNISYPHLSQSNDEIKKNFSVYVNVVGMTDRALSRLKRIHQVKLIIPDDCLFIQNVSYNDIFLKYCKNYNYPQDDQLVDMFYFTTYNTELQSFTNTFINDKEMPLIYLSFKYPDGISMIQNMCYFTFRSDTYFIAYKDYEANQNIFHQMVYQGIQKTELDNLLLSTNIIFQLNDLKSFQQLYPNLVYITDADNVYMLKLIKNCKYSRLSFFNELYPPKCNEFCYKPFYKKRDYIKLVETFSSILNETTLTTLKKKNGSTHMVEKRAAIKLPQYQYIVTYNTKVLDYENLNSFLLNENENENENENDFSPIDDSASFSDDSLYQNLSR